MGGQSAGSWETRWEANLGAGGQARQPASRQASRQASRRAPAVDQRARAQKHLVKPVGRRSSSQNGDIAFLHSGQDFWAVLNVRPCAHMPSVRREPRQIYLPTVQKMRIEESLRKSRDCERRAALGVTEIGTGPLPVPQPNMCASHRHQALLRRVLLLPKPANSGGPGVTSLGEGGNAFDENLERVVMRVQRLPADTFRYGLLRHEQGGIFYLVSFRPLVPGNF